MSPASRIVVTLEDGSRVEAAPQTPVGDFAPRDRPASELPYIGALVNNEVTSLTYPLDVNSTVRFLTMSDPHGWPIYERSVAFLLAKTVRELFPERRLALEYSLGPGVFCDFEHNGACPAPCVATEDEVRRIRDRMRELVAQDIPVERLKVSYDDVVALFEQSGQRDKRNLLTFLNPPKIVMHRCAGFSDLAHGPRAPSTGVLRCFDLIPYPPGFVLQFPAKGNPAVVAPFKDQPHLFRIFQEHKEWGRILGVNTVGRLNEVISNGEISEFIKISEALHEKKLARIADRITGQLDRARIVLIAGPSSAGKTTFAKRLAIQLRVSGLRPIAISTDNYFVETERTPRDAKGELDFEHIEAVDIELFNQHLLQLIHGEEVSLPRFDFQTRRRVYSGKKLKIDADQIILIEGIHGLNPRLTCRIPEGHAFRVYISALTQLSIDSNTRISTTDNRLLRRLVRDSKYRGHPAVTTLRMWPSVRRGEEIWVFPFQGGADETFNSALDYELAVLKHMAEPLLAMVKPSDPEYAEARRLSAFLMHFLAVSDREVPSTSILREHIGRSSFRY